ncbi:MAG: hypothetical protein K9H49_19160 [Bacteroidales bacterium]|nr:hypothetical protein [Bacteroidales bacterium]MCF8390707.1 hypothetical protein [Bacteroidales bacterium]
MRKLVTFILILSSFLMSYSQSTERTNALLFGAGIGISDGDKLMGGGPVISLAYLRGFNYNRLSFNPELSIGFFGARFVTDVPDMYFNSINIDFDFNFDLLRFRGLSLTLVAGPALNQKKGLIGTGGYPPGNEYSEYFRSSDLTFKFGGGIKIMPAGQKIIVEILPMNFRVGNDYFMEGFAMLYLGYRL